MSALASRAEVKETEYNFRNVPWLPTIAAQSELTGHQRRPPLLNDKSEIAKRGTRHPLGALDRAPEPGVGLLPGDPKNM